MLKRTALTFLLVVIAFYLYGMAIEKSLFAATIISICVRNQVIRRIYENVCILAIVLKLALPNVDVKIAAFINNNL